MTLGPYYQGDDQTIGLSFAKDDGSEYDITGWTVTVYVKKREDDSDSDAVYTETVTTHDAPTDGETSFTMGSDDTADLNGYYVLDVEVERTDGSVQTVVRTGIEFEP